jgi:hypothetical protein
MSDSGAVVVHQERKSGRSYRAPAMRAVTWQGDKLPAMTRATAQPDRRAQVPKREVNAVSVLHPGASPALVG